MPKYEVWGRKEIGKGKRTKLAYGIVSEAEAKRIRQLFIEKGFLDCGFGRTQDPYLAGAGARRRRQPKKN